MRRMTGWMLVGVMALALDGCAARSTSATGATGAPVDGAPVPANSPLSKIQRGMSKTQVTAILGPPSSESGYLTGKAFIPFYFGNDAHRTSYYYKGIGRVVFADGNIFGGGGNEVERLEYDPGESGAAR